MTAPDGGARTLTLQPGDVEMITEYVDPHAPLYVINTDPAAATVYLASDSSVSAGTGVPLNAGTSLPWAAGGQLWVTLDASAAGPVTLTLTSAIGDWQPSPAAIATQVAAKLLAQGIPNVLTENVLFTRSGANGIAVDLDVSGYASVTILVSTTPIVGTAVVQWTLETSDGSTVDADTVVGKTTAGQRIAVTAPTLHIASATSNLHVVVLGSNRAASARLDGRRNTAGGDRWALGSTVMATNGGPNSDGVYPLAQDADCQLQGQAWMSANVTGNAVGRLELIISTGSASRTVILADTTDMTGTTRKLNALVALPADPYTIQFRCTTAGTSAASVALIPSAV